MFRIDRRQVLKGCGEEGERSRGRQENCWERERKYILGWNGGQPNLEGEELVILKKKNVRTRVQGEKTT